ncbi:kelch repeat-containing protein [Burkholderia sola]|uniref:Kelch repeat-containing protein n=1 Tax=Burkholderia TaxID=32008 RepID=UPI001AEB4C56|nr:kelch repeat-containing protein [Burkholderia sp. AcTa6-5]
MQHTIGFLRGTALSFFAALALCGQAVGQSANGETQTTNEPPRWRLTKPMLTSRFGHTAVSLPDGHVLVTGGFGGKGGGRVLASSELYDAESQRWLKTGSMTVPLLAAKAVLLRDGRVLVAGGRSVETITVSTGSVTGLSFDGTPLAEMYTPERGAWSAVGPMATGRLRHTLTALQNGRVLAVGGQSGTKDGGVYEVLGSAELFDPTQGAWLATGSMVAHRTCHTATLLSDGKVLVAGGRTERPTYGSKTATSSAELYDPATGTWTEAAHMRAARCGHTATLLRSGKVLVAGGEDDERADEDAVVAEVIKEKGPNVTAADLDAAIAKDARPYLNSVEIYDPATGQWSSAGRMSGARSEHTAVLLPNGNVLFARGRDSRSLDLDSAEIYDVTKGASIATVPMHDAVGSGATLSLLPNGKLLAAGGDRGYVESKPGFRERLARGIFREDDFNNNSALASAELLDY